MMADEAVGAPRMSQKKTIAVDFDGVIHEYSRGWQGGEIYDGPVEGAIEAICNLYGKGYEIVILTTRTNWSEIKQWFCRHLPANQECPEFTVTNIKPPAIAYIDDRGIRFTSWKDVLNYF